MRNNIRIYEVKSEYIKYLGNYQKHIFAQANGKEKRKYIGIVFEIKGIKYFAPLSSFKTKHKQIQEGVDFIKIKDYAVINLNNMIPVPNSQIIDIDINKEQNASYRYLLQAESREINRQKNRIRKMQKLYIVTKNIMDSQHLSPKEQMILNCWKNSAKNIDNIAGSFFSYRRSATP